MSEQTLLGIAITIAVMGFVVILMRDHRDDPGIVLTVHVKEINGQLICFATGPGGGYKLSHSMYAAACLSAEAIRLMDQGVEGGMQVLQEQTMEVLNAN